MGEVLKFRNFAKEEIDKSKSLEEELSNLFIVQHGDQHVKPISLFIKGISGESFNMDVIQPKISKKYEPQNEKGDFHMDDGYKQLIRRLDEDSRERESRISAEMKEREERYERRSKEMEERLISLFGESIKKIDDKLNNHEKILETKLELINTKINHIEKQVDEIHNKTRFWVTLIVPTIVAIAVGLATIYLAR